MTGEAIRRIATRWVHLVFGIPIIGYIYSPFEQLPSYAPVVRYVATPAILLSGFWLWKGHALRRWLASPGRLRIGRS